MAPATATQDQPTIAKDSIQITAFTFNVYKGNYDNWSWVPRMQYRVNGPIASGSQLYVEYSLPTGPWVKFDGSMPFTQWGGNSKKASYCLRGRRRTGVRNTDRSLCLVASM